MSHKSINDIKPFKGVAFSFVLFSIVNFLKLLLDFNYIIFFYFFIFFLCYSFYFMKSDRNVLATCLIYVPTCTVSPFFRYTVNAGIQAEQWLCDVEFLNIDPSKCRLQKFITE